MGCNESKAVNSIIVESAGALENDPVPRGTDSNTDIESSYNETGGAGASIFVTGTRGEGNLMGEQTGNHKSNSANGNPLSPNVVSKAGMVIGQSFRFITSSAHHLKNVFAQPISQSVVPVESRTKTTEESNFLLTILKKHYLFEQVEDEHIQTLVSVFEKVMISKDDDPILIRQGESVDMDKGYFYILYQGGCSYSVDGNIVGESTPGDSFGELALLYDCPRAATVIATFQDDPKDATSHGEDHQEVILFRVDQLRFRQVLQNADQTISNSKLDLLNHVSFLQELSEDRKAELAAAMQARPFSEGEYLIRRGCTNGSWFLIEHGLVVAKDISYGANHRWNGRMSVYGAYQNVNMGRHDSFGHRSVLTGEKAVADCVAMSPGLAFVIDRSTFQSVLGDLSIAVLRSQDEMKLRSIPIVAETTQLDNRMLRFLASQIKEETLEVGTVICEKDQPLIRSAALFIVRKGKIKVEFTGRTETVLQDGYFGDDQLLEDTYDRETFKSSYTATVLETCECGVLNLQSCRRILDTYRMGEAQDIREFDSLVVRDVQQLTLDDFTMHRLIGAGTFGQVWLVSRKNSSGKQLPYALKIQSKYELCKSSQALLIVREKNVMAQFHNPFVGKLVSSFQDDKFVYMAMNLLQGGELFSLMHRSAGSTMPESEAMFYIACIAQGVSYMHRLGFVYRDLKPENVMIDNQGYAILIDFGFCKKIDRKTYTMCGTPLYLAPEVILNRGYNWSVDHWSLGIIVYEMMVGNTPFYKRHMTKTDLFRSIIKERVPVPTHLSSSCLDLISGLLKRDPTRRLGSLASGEDGILQHEWFSPIDQDLLFLKELEAPFLPIVDDVLDDSHFEDWGHVHDLREQEFPDLTPEQKLLFDSF